MGCTSKVLVVLQKNNEGFISSLTRIDSFKEEIANSNSFKPDKNYNKEVLVITIQKDLAGYLSVVVFMEELQRKESPNIWVGLPAGCGIYGRK